jgi:hypothetical protein
MSKFVVLKPQPLLLGLQKFLIPFCTNPVLRETAPTRQYLKECRHKPVLWNTGHEPRVLIYAHKINHRLIQSFLLI